MDVKGTNLSLKPVCVALGVITRTDGNASDEKCEDDVWETNK